MTTVISLHICPVWSIFVRSSLDSQGFNFFMGTVKTDQTASWLIRLSGCSGHILVSCDMTNQQRGCVPSEDSDQPGHPPSLIRVFAVQMKKPWVLSYPLSTRQRLWSDWADAQTGLSLDGRTLIFLVLSCRSSCLFIGFSGHIHVSCDMTKPTVWLCTQQRLRSAWASAQSDQSLRCPHEKTLGP